MTVSGCTILRNAQRLGYPFIESILSILPLCHEFVISIGESDDDTLPLCRELARTQPKIKVLTTRWNALNTSGGTELSVQTNRCLAQCSGKWIFYIQADEVVHEADLNDIRMAIERANRHPQVDGLAFDYLHFYGDYRHTITGRSWYRREVRAIKSGRGIESFRDAQGFRKNGKPLCALPANARIFHYGYVRTPEMLQEKSIQMSKWWGGAAGSDFRLRRHVGLGPFHRSHPCVMRERTENHRAVFNPHQCPRVWDRKEIKDLLTIAWERIIPFRIGEFRNYRLFKCVE